MAAGKTGILDPVETLRAFFMAAGVDPQVPSIVAFSGGPDSTALLAALVEAGAGRLRAVHLDHGLRPQAELAAELDVLRGTCRRLSVPLTVAHLRPGAIADFARLRRCGIEAAARTWRYHVLGAALAREGAGIAYLGHTRDDQLETILMRALSGAGPSGLGGMRPFSAPWARPFLGLPKAVLLSWLSSRGFDFSVDSSNGEDGYLRNRLRHHVVPALARSFPGWEGGLLSMAEKAALAEEAIEGRVRLLGFRSEGGLLRASTALLGEADAVCVRAYLDAAALALDTCAARGHGRAAAGRRISSRLARSAIEAMRAGAGRHRGGGLELRRRGESLELALSLDFPVAGGYFVVVHDPGDGVAWHRLGSVRIAVTWCSGALQRRPGRLREAAFSFPLIVRSRRPGDLLPIKGGRKDVDALLSEQGLAPATRGLVPVLEDRDGLLGVLAGAFGGKDRFRQSDAADTGRYLAIVAKGA